MFITKPLIDGSGRCVVCYVNASSQIILSRFNGTTGDLIDQTSFTDCVSNVSVNRPSITYDSSNNIYLAYPITVSGQGVNIKLVKLSASDITTTLATSASGINSVADDYQVHMAWNSDKSTLYVANATSTGSIVVTRFNTGLVLVASSQTVVGSGASYPSIHVNANYVVIAYLDSSKVRITRMNLSLGVQEITGTVSLGISEGDEYNPQVFINSDDYITVGYRTVVGGVSKNKIFKMDHTFNLTWNVASQINVADNDNYFNDMYMDSLGVIYYASYSLNDVYLYKVNKIGQVTWTKTTALELNSDSIEYNPTIAIGSNSLFVACVSNFIGSSDKILLGKYTSNFANDFTGLSNITISSSNLSFNANKASFEASIGNGISSVNVTVSKGDAGQTVSTTLNSVSLGSLTGVSIPVGRNTFAITVTSTNTYTSGTYYVYLTRDPPAIAYLDLVSGSGTNTGASGSPINSLRQALSLGVPVVVKLNQFVPSALVGDSTLTLNSQTGGPTLSSTYDSFKSMNVVGTSSSKRYFFTTMDPVVSDINGLDSIMSFFIKEYDTETEDVVTSDLNQTITFACADVANRSYLKLYRIETNGSYTDVGNVTRIDSSNYTITLASNSVYTLVDSGVLYTGVGIGSDPYVTTISGRKYQIPKIRGRNNGLTLIKNGSVSLKGHMTGLYDGDYLDRVVLEDSKNSLLEINFSKKTSKVKDSGKIKKMFVENMSVAHFKTSNKLNEVFYVKDSLHRGGVYLVVNYQHRYVFPVFNHALTEEDIKVMSGVLIS